MKFLTKSFQALLFYYQKKVAVPFYPPTPTTLIGHNSMMLCSQYIKLSLYQVHDGDSIGTQRSHNHVMNNKVPQKQSRTLPPSIIS